MQQESLASSPGDTGQRYFSLADQDCASLIFFRLCFGLAFAFWAWDYLKSGRAQHIYIDPEFHFTYRYFEWVKPLPGDGMLAVFVAILILATAVAAGVFYRGASLAWQFYSHMCFCANVPTTKITTT